MELKNNQGIIFVNDRKIQDKQPDYCGEINLEGKSVRISLWKCKAKTGRPYFSVRVSTGGVKPKEQVKEEPKRDSFVDDEIPWE